MFNMPDDIYNYDDHPMSPLYEDNSVECPACGSTMTISSIDKDILECDNSTSCGNTVEINQETGFNEWE